MKNNAARLAMAGCAAVAFSVALAGCTSQDRSAPTVQTSAAIDGQLLEDVRILSADDMQGRDTGSEGGAKARAYIISRFEALGIEAPLFGREQRFERSGETRSGPKTYNGVNIIGVIPGHRVPDRYIVVTAHYDHVGTNGGHTYNGADDNASGVAAMLALAAQLKRQAPDHSVLLVALDGEERGLMGAREFVSAPPVPLSAMSLNLNLDMIARAESDNFLWATGTYQHPNLRPILETVPARGGISLAFGKDTPQDLGADNWVMASDHGAFHEKGVPFIYLGVNYHPDYHRPSDDFERILPAVFTNATELTIASFRALDQALDR